jgi:hypothetical protein
MIYFIRNETNGRVKIGYSANVKARLASLQTASPDKLTLLASIPGEKDREKSLHNQLCAHRLNGEWFDGGSVFMDRVAKAIRHYSPPVIRGREIHSVYLAGKISQGDWRETIVGADLGYPDGHELGPHRPWPSIPFHAAAKEFVYVGPYFVGCSHGCSFRARTHAWIKSNCSPSGPALDTWGRCMGALRSADLVFAWIDSPDCHGTIAEIAAAHAIRTPVLISGPTFLPDLWFVYHFADRVAFAGEEGWATAKTAFVQMVACEQGEPFPEWRVEGHGDRLDPEECVDVPCYSDLHETDEPESFQ